jgi:hypothetical protein
MPHFQQKGPSLLNQFFSPSPRPESSFWTSRRKFKTPARTVFFFFLVCPFFSFIHSRTRLLLLTEEEEEEREDFNKRENDGKQQWTTSE